MKLFWLVLIVTALPILPLLLVDGVWDQRLSDWTAAAGERHGAALAILVVGLLAADIFLPTPSGPIATIAGASLGVAPAIAVVWIGLMIGAITGRLVAEKLGRSFANRLAGPSQLEELGLVFAGRERWLLLATRPLPIVAETMVLLAGLAGLPWRRFLPPVALGNFVFTVVLTTMGAYAADSEWLSIAIATAATVPSLALMGLRKRWKRGAE